MKLVFRLPGKPVQCWEGNWKPIEGVPASPVFRMRGFDLRQKSGFDFYPEQELEWDGIFPNPKTLMGAGLVSTIESDFKDGVLRALSLFHEGKLDKLVLSRVLIYTNSNEIELGAYFNSLVIAYPDCFVAIAELPDGCVWIGATPEKLMEVENGMGNTMALAGTGLEKSDIGRKEEIEHRWVEQEIMEELEKQEMKFTQKGPGLVSRNGLFHLETRFSWPMNGKEQQLIEALHPTAAVGSYPTSEWKKYLPEMEKHNRDYYAGYWGPIFNQDDMHLFVNLRCCSVWADGFVFYGGAGLTSGSEPGAEWLETGRKIESTRKFLEN